MKTQLKTLTAAALAGLTALAVTAAPAMADDNRRDGRGYEQRWDDRRDDRRGDNYRSINERQRDLERRIERGIQRGTLSRWEASRIVQEFRQLASLERRYRQNGLNGWERADLDRRFDRLEAQVRYENRDRDYGSGYGYGQRR